MAINFPNYLAAQLYKPDFSGIGDVVENYYKGKSMPKDDLIKQVAAEFARPNAQEALTGSRLGNEKVRLENAKARLEAQQNAALEAQIAAALRGENSPANATPAARPAPVMALAQAPAQRPQMPMAEQPNPNNMTFQQGQNPLEGMGLHPALVQAIQQMRQQQSAPQQEQQPEVSPMSQMSQSQPSEMAPEAGAQSTPESAAGTAPEANPAGSGSIPGATPLQVITQGEPRLAAIDALYDRNPLSRALLEKKGFKKKTEVKFDQKTGQTRILTTYPSGKVTLQLASPGGTAGDGIPLTNKMISKHQNIISSVDVALPILDKILNLKGFSAYPLSSLGIPSVFGNKQAKYDSLVNQALDSLMGAFGLPLSNEGLKTVKDQLEIRHFETPGAYRKRITKLVEELKSRKAYSSEQVKKSNKIQPVGRMGNDQGYSSDEWEQV